MLKAGGLLLDARLLILCTDLPILRTDLLILYALAPAVLNTLILMPDALVLIVNASLIILDTLFDLFDAYLLASTLGETASGHGQMGAEDPYKKNHKETRRLRHKNLLRMRDHRDSGLEMWDLPARSLFQLTPYIGPGSASLDENNISCLWNIIRCGGSRGSAMRIKKDWRSKKKRNVFSQDSAVKVRNESSLK